MYGPFWIQVTLIFTIAISGNLAKFFQHDHTGNYVWHYNFHLVSIASTCIIAYVCIMPVVIWSVLKWSVNLNDDQNLDLESVSASATSFDCFHAVANQLISGSFSSQSALNYLPLRIFACSLRSGFDFVDHPSKILIRILKRLKHHFLRRSHFFSGFSFSLALSCLDQSSSTF